MSANYLRVYANAVEGGAKDASLDFFFYAQDFNIAVRHSDIFSLLL